MQTEGEFRRVNYNSTPLKLLWEHFFIQN